MYILFKIDLLRQNKLYEQAKSKLEASNLKPFVKQTPQ